ncbi:molybdenum ABC transporter ATP-binding protein [Ramlibacter sp.]|uniref:molybdenum ABC transporter ATP-binding protein n=1 Tax=Ramlibacter sp. TaxID=1917967 RepID=UPI0035B11272
MIDLDLRLTRAAFELQATLRLPARGVTALFGPSGCGKTTLLRALAGLERAQGHVRLDGEVWQDDARGLFVPTHARSLGYVIQEAALFPHLDVGRNLDYGLRRTPVAQRRIELAQIVDLLGIGPLMERRPATLSGGERQRVAIARALAASPKVLLMDEPLAALDAKRKREVLPYLERMQRDLGLPIVYVSHSIDEVAQLADHLVLLDAGRVRAAGPFTEVLSRLDLPPLWGDEIGVVLDGVVAERDAHWHLARLDVDGGAAAFWSRDQGLPVGRRARLRVLARDVSLTRERQQGTSIGNQLAGTVESLTDDSHPGLALVRVRVGGIALVARLTRRSADALALAPGLPVWAQVKTVALME